MDNNSLYQLYFDCELSTKEEVHTFISEVVSRDNSLPKEEVIHQLNEREKIGSTLIAEHVMLPHIESEQIEKSQILFIRLANSIETWDTKEKNIQLLIVISLNKNESVQIKKEIASFTRSLADEEYVNYLLTCQEEELIKEIIQY